MSATIDTVRVRTKPDHADDSETSGAAPPDRKMLEVSDVDPDRVTAYARASAAEGHPDIYFERKGSRTFLVAD